MKEYGKEVTTSLIGHPARQVVSMLNTPAYKLAKFLDSIIEPYAPKSYTVQSTDDFFSKTERF